MYSTQSIESRLLAIHEHFNRAQSVPELSYTLLLSNVDVDECLTGGEVAHGGRVCGDDRRCVNTEGAFECVDSCHAGFEPDPADPLGPCVDVDECLQSNRSCTLAEK